MKTGMARRYAAEFVGTFGIVFAPVALAGTAGLRGADTSLLAAALASGLPVMAAIYAFGPLSGAHLNPAVTVVFAAAGRFPWRYVLPYTLAQLSGGTAAAAVAALLFGPGHGAHVPGVAPGLAVAVEVCLTFLLMLIIMALATDRRANPAIPGLVIGSTVLVNVLIGGPVTGGSMNPARSFGPALFAGGPALAGYWIYAVGPVIGAIGAALVYEALRGGEQHARGAPNDLAPAKSVQPAEE